MPRQRRAFKRFWSNPGAMVSLGCTICPDRKICGGQTVVGAGFNCLDNCCYDHENCELVCPNSHVFVDRVREVNGLELHTPQTQAIPLQLSSNYVPLVFHGSALSQSLSVPTIAIPFYLFFDRHANCRFETREDISRVFKIDINSQIILSGVAKDRKVESWWKLEAGGRVKIIKHLRRLGIDLVTTPNFSLMVDRPRWDDLHSMKRIAEVHHEFVSEGVSAALHINSRTEQDFARWAEYLNVHSEITHIAYEFTTGTKNPDRMDQHVNWLIDVAQSLDRPVNLVLRGGVRVLRNLSEYYNVVFIDSSPFEKAQHREVVIFDEYGSRRWIKRSTEKREPIDSLFHENVRASEKWLATILPKLAFAA